MSIQPISIHAIDTAAAMVYMDIDSVVCSYCDKTCHSADYFWKRLRDEKKLFKGIALRLLTIGAGASVFLDLFL